MVDFLAQHGTGHSATTAKLRHNRRSIITPPQIFQTFESYRQNGYLGVIRERLPGWWREIKGIVGGTKFTRLALTINNTIRRFSGVV